MTPALEQIKALPAKWREEADEIAAHNMACNANSIRARAGELDTALQALRDEAGEAVAGGWSARWANEGDDSLILLTHPVLGGVGVWKHPREGRPMLEEMLYSFGESLIRPAPAAEAAPQGGRVVLVPRKEGPALPVRGKFARSPGEMFGHIEPAATPPSAPAVADSEAMGASGGPANELERLAFEAWMRGHCWALSATWNGTEYRSDAEQGGRYCPQAATTRMLWAAWRDRAALSAPVPQEGVDEAMVERALEARLGLHTRVRDMLRHPDQHQQDSKWPAAIMRAALEAALAAGALPQVDASWLADVRRCLEDVSTEMRSSGRGDERFQRLIQRMPRLAAAPAQGVR